MGSYISNYFEWLFTTDPAITQNKNQLAPIQPQNNNSRQNITDANDCPTKPIITRRMARSIIRRRGNNISLFQQLDQNKKTKNKGKNRKRKKIKKARVEGQGGQRGQEKSKERGAEHTCSICITGRKTTIALPCLHKFHRKCLSEWRKVNTYGNCPDCRNPFTGSQIFPLQWNKS